MKVYFYTIPDSLFHAQTSSKNGTQPIFASETPEEVPQFYLSRQRRHMVINMSDNVSKDQIFNQIAELQKSLESIEKNLFTIQCVAESQACVEQEDGEHIPLEYFPDVAIEKIKAIREIVLEREKTINKMLDFYLRLYQGLETDEKE